MTVCAAGICRLNARRKKDCIICVSDRLITCFDQNDVPVYQSEMEKTTKVFGMAPANCLVLFSGDRKNHFDIVTQTHQQAIKENLTDIREIALWYSNHLTKFSQNKPKQDAGVKIIIAGFDSAGPHLFCVDGDGVDCFDSNGFCAVGSGEDLFRKQREFAGYDRHWSKAKAIWEMYQAKKKAERDPFVGKITDVCMIHEKDNGRMKKAAKALEAYQRTLDAKQREIIKLMGKDLRFLLTNPRT